MVERWKVLESHLDPLLGPFSLRRDRAMLPLKGVTHEFILLESPDWVNIVPVTDDGQMVMVRQHRLGTNCVELEIPGGLIDPQDERPVEAAKRELLEETGYQAEDWRLIGTVAPNPALQTNRCYTFLARGCWRVGPPRPDEKEPLEAVEVPLAKLPALITSGSISHALALNGLFWYFIHEGKIEGWER